jgi:hypothetical protein
MKRALKVISVSLLGVAVGYWSEYPEDFQPSDPTVLAMTFGGVIGLLLACYFASLVTARAFGCAFLFSALAAWIAGILPYENHFYRAEGIAGASSLAFFLWCAAAYGVHKWAKRRSTSGS